MDRPWETEPDAKDFWAHGLPCAMRRGPGGHWCGYVGIPREHPLWGKDYSSIILAPLKSLIERPIDIDKVGVMNIFCVGSSGLAPEDGCELALLLDVHGGLTYAADHAPGGEAGEHWYFGFDCAHAGDIAPKHLAIYEEIARETGRSLADRGEVYRDLAYVVEECTNLARQLAQWGKPA